MGEWGRGLPLQLERGDVRGRGVSSWQAQAAAESHLLTLPTQCHPVSAQPGPQLVASAIGLHKSPTPGPHDPLLCFSRCSILQA